MGPTSARAVVATILVLLLIAGGLIAATGQAQGYGIQIPYGFVTPDGSFVEPNVQGLLGDTPITPGSLVFGDALDILFLNAGGNRTVEVSSFQNGTPGMWLNQSFAVSSQTVTLFSFTLPASALTVPTRFCVDGGCMDFLHKTPITLFPSGIINVGGLDVLAFAITLETLVLMAPLTLWARALTKRAIWTPNIKWWLVLPHVVLGAVLLVAAEFPLLDELFGGLEFVFFPLVLAFLWFFWVMHLFNGGKAFEAMRPEPRGGGDVDVYRWRAITGDLPDGRKVIVGAKWAHWFQRLRGHAPVIWDPKSATEATPVPAPARVITKRTDTRDEARDRILKEWQRYRSGPGHPTPFDTFRVASNDTLGYREKDPPQLLYFVDSDRWLEITMPYLSWHRDVQEPAVIENGKVIRPARVKQKWAWPHYIDPPVAVAISDRHWMDTLAAWLDWVPQQRAYRQVQALRRENYALRAGHYVVSDELARQATEEVFGLVARERFPITLKEAQEEARRGEKDKGGDTGDGSSGPEGPGDSDDAPSGPEG